MRISAPQSGSKQQTGWLLLGMADGHSPGWAHSTTQSIILFQLSIMSFHNSECGVCDICGWACIEQWGGEFLNSA